MKKIMVILYTISISGTIHAMHQVKSPANAQQNQSERDHHTTTQLHNDKLINLQRPHHNPTQKIRITLKELIERNSKL